MLSLALVSWLLPFTLQFANFEFLVIGRGGSKINEIRSQSSCQIRVTDPGTTVPGGAAANPEERLVTITGYPDNINAAVALLYSVCCLVWFLGCFADRWC